MGRKRSQGVRWIVCVAALLTACETGESNGASNEPLAVADISMSIAELEDLRQQNPEQVDIGLVLGERYRRMGQLDDAESAFQRVLDGAGAPDLEAGALGGLGLVAQSRDDLAAAEQRLREALSVAEAAGLEGVAREQRVRLAVLERVRGDFVTACAWYAQAGLSGQETQLTVQQNCDAPTEVLALSASIWRAHASATMEGLVVESRLTKTLAADAEAAVARGALAPDALAPALGDYSRLVLYAEGAEAAEAVARRAIALDPGRSRLQLHLISPLLLQGRDAEADEAVDAVLSSWTRLELSGSSPEWTLRQEFDELEEAGLYRPYMDEVLSRFAEHRASLRY